IIMVFTSFFFFQAEDGIRDLIVTGVQTCALPIFRAVVVAAENMAVLSIQPNGHVLRRHDHSANPATPPASATNPSNRIGGCVVRSEERRVGKECRSRVSPERATAKAASNWWSVHG